MNKYFEKLQINSFTELKNHIISNIVDINDLGNYKDIFTQAYDMIYSTGMSGKEVNMNELSSLLQIMNDYYCYSENGDVLVTDMQYDHLMNLYISLGGERIIYADNIHSDTMWNFVKHEERGMVGSLAKIYTMQELEKYLYGISVYPKDSVYNKTVRRIRLSPKYDGISVSIKVVNRRAVLALTRNNGFEGQDITRVVLNAANSDMFRTVPELMYDGYYKCELVMTTENFNSLIQEKVYANRRSATSGIVNTPKNLPYAKYITIVPLAHMSFHGDIRFIAPDSIEIKATSVEHVREEIDNMLERIRNAEYPIRTDGVVITPLGSDIYPNINDIMDSSIAFKVNTEMATTQIEYGYVSVGIMGFGIPMLKVKPVEVNETIVTDISLGSFDSFITKKLHEGETIIVYSAGNVIPQMKVPEQRKYPAGADWLEIKKICPYCDEKLTRFGAEYRCTNERCSRVNAGRIVNFLSKLKVDGVSEKTIETLYNEKLIKDIPSVFDLKEEQIAVLEGFGERSAQNIIEEINKLRVREITESEFLGALGILDVAEKKARKILKAASLKYMLEHSKSDNLDRILNGDSIGGVTATNVAEFIKENKSMIRDLLDIMNIVSAKNWKGNIVFTGFRNNEWEKRLNNLSFEVSDNVNKDTIFVVTPSYNPADENKSGKIKSAEKKNLDIILVSDFEKMIEKQERNSNYFREFINHSYDDYY